MNAFSLRNVTDIIFGAGTEARCPELIRQYGGSRVMIVHTGEPFVIGLIAQIRKGLEESGIWCTELSGVVPNPRFDLGEEGIRQCREEKVDFLLAVGGGSVIDTAKMIAFGYYYEGDLFALCNGQTVEEKIWPCLPIGVVSTIAATGSEMTIGSVITKDGIKGVFEYILFRPKFCILNPEITMTTPPFQTACGAADIFSHLLENYMSSSTESDLAESMLTAGLRTVIKHAPIAVADPKNYQSRSELMLLAPIGVYGITKVGRSGDWGAHEIEHALSAKYNIPHGAGLAIIIPVWMRYVYKKHPDLFVRYAVKVHGIEPDTDLEKTALAGIEATETFLFDRLGLPRNLRGLGFDGVTEEDIRTATDHIFHFGAPAVGRTCQLTREDCFRILLDCR